MVEKVGDTGLEPDKSQWDLHPCTDCKDREYCAEQEMACAVYRGYLNPKFKRTGNDRIPRKDLFV